MVEQRISMDGRRVNDEVEVMSWEVDKDEMVKGKKV